jgi:hypothetical protein
VVGDIGESLARELGFDLRDEPEPLAAAPSIPEVEPTAPPAATPAAPTSAEPSPYGGPMPGMGASPRAPGAFAGFTLPPSPFLMLRHDGSSSQATPEPGPPQP